MPAATDDSASSSEVSAQASSASSSSGGEDSSGGEASSDIEEERSAHVRHRASDGLETPEEQEAREGGEQDTTEPRAFTVVRHADESGVSGTGRVLDGCIFHNGQVVVCWRGDINSEKSGYSSLAIYPCWDAFYTVHIGAHPENKTEVVFGHSADLMARLIDRAAENNSDADESSNSEDDSEKGGSAEETVEADD